MTIGEMAKAATVGVETVRFYQRRGLLQEPARRPGRARRVYTDESLAELRFIRRCTALGFSLKQVEVLVRLRRGAGRGSCDAVHEHLAELVADLEQQRREIDLRLATLACLCAACPGHQPVRECGALAALDAAPPS